MKLFSEFHKDKNSSDGYYSSCKDCRNLKSPRLLKKKLLDNQNQRQCSKCGQIKLITEFWGKRNECIECRIIYNTNYYNLNKSSILQTIKNKHKKFPWKLIYKWMKDRCDNPKDTNYKNYGGRGIKYFITEEEVKELWFRDKAYEMDRPSIDRIDNDGNYTYDNCQFIEMEENRVKDKRKVILQYDLNGNFIREWQSISDAQHYYGKTIIDCLRKTTKTSKGFIWKYKIEVK